MDGGRRRSGAWLERRDDGAGEGKGKKRQLLEGGREGSEKGGCRREATGGKEAPLRLGRPNELFGLGTKIIIEISCRWTKHLKKDCLPLISHRRICLQNYNQAKGPHKRSALVFPWNSCAPVRLFGGRTVSYGRLMRASFHEFGRRTFYGIRAALASLIDFLVPFSIFRVERYTCANSTCVFRRWDPPARG